MLMILVQHHSHYELIKLIQLQDVIFQSRQSTLYTVMRENKLHTTFKSDNSGPSVWACAVSFGFGIHRNDLKDCLLKSMHLFERKTPIHTLFIKCMWPILMTFVSVQRDISDWIIILKLNHEKSQERIDLKPLKKVLLKQCRLILSS